MPRGRKNATVNEEASGAIVEEKKTARRGRPRKNPLPEVKEEAAAEVPVEEAAPAEEGKEEAPVKVPAKRGRKKKTETAAEEKKEKTAKEPAKRGRKKKTETAEAPADATITEVETILQYSGHEIKEKDMIEKVEAAWKAEGNTSPIESITMYVKPEEHKIYYLVNGLAGSVDLF